MHRGGIPSCDLWAPFHQRVLLEVGANILKVQQFDDILKKDMEEDLDGCNHCQTRVRNWRAAFARRLGEIPSFDAGMLSDAGIYILIWRFTLSCRYNILTKIIFSPSFKILYLLRATTWSQILIFTHFHKNCQFVFGTLHSSSRLLLCTFHSSLLQWIKDFF